MEERINAAIQGVEEPGSELTPYPQPSTTAIWAGWNSRQVLCLRFEDLILDRAAALGRLLDYLEQRGFTPQSRSVRGDRRPGSRPSLPKNPAPSAKASPATGASTSPRPTKPCSKSRRAICSSTWATSRTKPGEPGEPQSYVYPAALSRKTCPPLAAADADNPLRYRRRLPDGTCPCSSPTRSPRAARTCSPRFCRAFPAFGPTVDSGLPAIVTFQGDTGRPRAPARSSHDLQRLLPATLPTVTCTLCPRWSNSCPRRASPLTSSCAIRAMWSSRTCIT